MKRHTFARALTGLTAGMAMMAGCQAVPVQASTDPAASGTPASQATPERRADFQITGQLTQGGWIRGQAPTGAASLILDGTAVALDRDGTFFAAFDRDATGSARLVAKLDTGQSVVRDIAVSKRAWQIENVNVARRQGGPSEDFMRIRRPELAQINAARALDTKSDGWRQKFIWPVTGRISGRFGSQRIYRGEPGSYHSGLDIATGTSGTPFVAPADGTVILAAQTPFTLEGHLLMIDHGMGLNSAFLHCSQLLVKVGDRVKQGQVIGKIGSSGRATGPHLHWSMKWRDARIDPILLTGPMP